ncbi:MAG: helix-turn-helix domain-containing protein [Oscillospiraceae bacterium]|nr:helix-turn-helix domain-containing protein [Oscillospiraceae bacterium]
MKLYEPPTKEFFRLPNKIFQVPLDATQFKLYSFFVCCSGSNGYCWPTMETIMRDTGIQKSSLQKAIKILKKRQLIEVRKHYKPTGNANNEYHLLSLDNPEIYRDFDPVDDDELPLTIGGDAA